MIPLPIVGATAGETPTLRLNAALLKGENSVFVPLSVKKLFLLLFLFQCALVMGQAQHAPRKERPFVLYGQFLIATTVEVSDGSQWAMDKGDCFPIHMPPLS